MRYTRFGELLEMFMTLTPSLLLVSLLLFPQQEAEGSPDDQGFRIGVAVDQVFLSVNARSVNGGV